MTVYLDHAATAPLRPQARDAWLEATGVLGNPSSIHGSGQRARRLLEDARERIAAVLGCQPIEVVLTSGGTESVNLALKGLWWARPSGHEQIVLPDGEHHATLDTVRWLVEHEGAEALAVPVDEVARIRADLFAEALASPGAALATALVANNEVGTVQDAVLLASLAAAAGVPLHLDAVAALGHVPVDFAGWRGGLKGAGGLVALSISGHKIGAPVGTGALVVSRSSSPSALLHGGGQQRGLRSGTQDAAGATALAVACELADAEREAENARLGALAERLIAGVRDTVPAAILLGDTVDRLSGNVH
ncbi:MAG: aminotransferase class V-fold PLP-dependent enzyme, partial [Microbacterium sp.]